MPIDHRDWRPPYRQVADALRTAIQSGGLPPGSRLPSVRELSLEWGVTPVTIEKAIRVLKAEGLVDVQAGRGTYVRQPRPLIHQSLNYLESGATWQSEAAAQGMRGSQRLLGVEEVLAPAEIAVILGGPATIVRRRLMLLEDEPAQLANTYYPRSIAGGTELAEERPLQGGTVAALGRLGVGPTRFHEDWFFRMPTPDEARWLLLSNGVPVARMLRTSFAVNLPVSVDEAILAGDRHVLSNDF